MKANELIEILQKEISDHGDLEVFYDWFQEIAAVDYQGPLTHSVDTPRFSLLPPL